MDESAVRRKRGSFSSNNRGSVDRQSSIASRLSGQKSSSSKRKGRVTSVGLHIRPRAKNPRAEIRNPKSETPGRSHSDSDFGFRISFGFRPSDFGFPTWAA